jgi:transcriptional regulator with XRE-family HTH domain
LVQRARKHIQPDPGPQKAFGQALREIRKEQGISQEKLALDSGFDRTYISLVERGIQSPTVKKVVKIAQILNVKPSEILQRMEQILATKPPAPV